MKKKVQLRAGWLKLSLFFFTTLIVIIFSAIGLLYPKMEQYIEYSTDLKAQSLTASARDYLLDSTELVIHGPLSEAQQKRVQHNLDIAYGLLNLNLYIKKYPCTVPSLKNIDLLSQLVATSNPVDMVRFSQVMLPVQRCMAVIQMGQDQSHAQMASNMAEEFSHYRNFILCGGLIAFVAGLGFLALHIKQSRLIKHNHKETHKWIRQATHDALTGALNRRAFDMDLANYVEQYNQNDTPFSLLLCDIDYFKQYNDRLGHVEGDLVLQQVTQALAKVLREGDYLYRYGGDEMIIILDNTDQLQAPYVGQRVLEQVRQLALMHPSSKYGLLTMSIGCATINDSIDSGTSLVKLTDKYLYEAKKNGRNCMASNSGEIYHPLSSQVAISGI